MCHVSCGSTSTGCANIASSAALVQGLGPSCEPHIRPMLKPLLKYCRPSRPVMDRAMAVGLFAEIAEGIGAAIAPHVPALWPAIYAAMRDPSPKLQVRWRPPPPKPAVLPSLCVALTPRPARSRAVLVRSATAPSHVATCCPGQAAPLLGQPSMTR